MKVLSPVIRQTTGVLVTFKEESRFGFINIDDEKWNDAFVSQREFLDGEIKIGMKVSFDLHENERGYFAKNVKELK